MKRCIKARLNSMLGLFNTWINALYNIDYFPLRFIGINQQKYHYWYYVSSFHWSKIYPLDHEWLVPCCLFILVFSSRRRHEAMNPTCHQNVLKVGYGYLMVWSVFYFQWSLVKLEYIMIAIIYTNLSFFSFFFIISLQAR